MTMKEQEQQAPMVNREKLTALLERVRAATGPDRELDVALARALVPDVLVMRQRDDNSGADPYTHWEYTDFVDDALALTKRVLPGWRWGVASHSIKDGKNEPGWPLHHDGFRAHVTERSALRPMPSVADAPTPALAIIAATLSALIAQAQP